LYQRERTAFNLDEALQMVDGDMDLLKELLQLFLEELPKRLTELSDAIKEMNFQDIQSIAHIIKGASANLSLVNIYNLALKIENCAKDREIEDIKESYKNLREELEYLEEYLSQQEWMKE